MTFLANCGHTVSAEGVPCAWCGPQSQQDELKLLKQRNTDLAKLADDHLLLANGRKNEIIRLEGKLECFRNERAVDAVRIERLQGALESIEVCALDVPERVRAYAKSALAASQHTPHPDDIAVDRFAAAMKVKLAKKRGEGRGGWEDPSVCSVEDLWQWLDDHTRKGDPIDVGNFAMMIWNRQQHTAGSGESTIQPRPDCGDPEGHSI